MEKLIPLLDLLAKKLGTTAEYLWGILVKQALINSLMILAALIAMTGITYAAWKCLRYAQKRAKEKQWEQVWVMISFLIGLILLVLWIVCLSSLPDMLTGFINPEYWALKEILNAIK